MTVRPWLASISARLHGSPPRPTRARHTPTFSLLAAAALAVGTFAVPLVLATPAQAQGTLSKSPVGNGLSGSPAPSPTACMAASQDATAHQGWTDTQVASAYGVNSLFDQGAFGQGQIIALLETGPYSPSDLATFASCYFGPHGRSLVAHVKTTSIDGAKTTGPTSGEATLDIEDILAMAPGATIEVFQTVPTTFGLIDAWTAMVNSNANLMSASIGGGCEPALQVGRPAFIQIQNNLFEKAAMQGKTVFSSSGDAGSDTCGGSGAGLGTSGSSVEPSLAVNDPTSQPFVTSVGGTTMLSAANPPQEEVWNGKTGGGISVLWPTPPWQAADGLKTAEASYLTNPTYQDLAGGSWCPTAATVGCRMSPDVSAIANPGITVYEARRGGWAVSGGTSSSAPLWAAIVADINSSPECANTSPVAHDLGLLNPLLYSVANSPAEYAQSFNNITQGSNASNSKVDGAYPATVGYSMAAGLGTPKAGGLAQSLCRDATSASRPTVTGLTPSSGSIGGGTTVTITGSNLESSNGTPLVYFGAAPASVLSASPNKVVAVAPAYFKPAGSPENPGGAASVTVSAGGMTSAPTTSGAYVYQAVTSGGASLPTITRISPTGGPQGGGNVAVIYGSGFNNVKDVSFGKQMAPVLGVGPRGTWIKVMVPSQHNASECVGVSTTNPVDSICQVNVQVVTNTGSSVNSHIEPSLTGQLAFSAQGIAIPPSNCGCETEAASTEYDYAPSPRVTGFTITPGTNGGAIATVTGSGFNLLTLEGVVLVANHQSNTAAGQVFSFASFSPDSIGIKLSQSQPIRKIELRTLGGLVVFASPHNG